jgi:hypothetical protein
MVLYLNMDQNEAVLNRLLGPQPSPLIMAGVQLIGLIIKGEGWGSINRFNY